jgi:hypothetical protein
MDLIDELNALSSKVSKQINLIQTEEATKNAFIMPFINALGYNVFDPTEVTPELTADVGTKKGEKVDYAILKDGKPIMLFECKWCGTDLDKEHKSQLYRYFSVTDARLGVLTNGVIYRFYTDLEEPNKMDARPFLEFNLLDMKESTVEELKRFSKSFFSLDETLTAATELKYTTEIKRIFAEQLINPSENFVKFFASQVYSGKLTQVVKQQFTGLTKKALNHFINDRINDRLKSALTTADEEDISPSSQPFQPPDKTQKAKVKSNKEAKKEKESRRMTQDDEEGYMIVTEIIREVIDPDRIVKRDTSSYSGILFDGNNRKPICRLHFNNPNRKYLGLFDKNKTEEKVLISQLSQIRQYADRLKTTVGYYKIKKQREVF